MQKSTSNVHKHDDIRVKIGAAIVIIGIAQSSLKEGSSDPEEQPEVLLREAGELLSAAYDELGVTCSSDTSSRDPLVS